MKESPSPILQTQLQSGKPRNIKKPTESVRSSHRGKPPAKRKMTKEEQDGEEEDAESKPKKAKKASEAVANAKK